MTEYIKDFKWKKGLTTKQFVEQLGSVGYQSIELKRAADARAKMKRERAKIFLTFTDTLSPTLINIKHSPLYLQGILLPRQCD